ncbi:DUF6491 family protein [Oleiagrimonas sp. C23AA]|uniref:DUF6491 family protein n=1 Tax=Oleiagrimonas sp. C23AA TaxID=2719047 RepID=UPI0014226A8F|nr:DUF6491 family protein [Oleiagrimonas sp. C23AA]NII11938.1 hypothetical protein [Oleiagrimonas sp. C23AA]
MKTRNVLIMWTATGLAMLGLAGCAGMNSRTDAQQLSLVQSAAGKPQPSFHLLTSLYSWEAIDDTHLLVYARPSQAYLLDVSPCPDLGSSFAIRLTTHVDDVVAGLDEVVVQGTGIGIPCTISRIRPVDVKALHAAQKQPAPEARKISRMPRTDAPKPAGADGQ